MKYRKISLYIFFIFFLIGTLGITFLFIPFNTIPQVIIFEKGTNISQITKTLSEANIVKSERLSKIVAYISHIIGHPLKSGEYEFEDKESIYSAIRKIAQGKIKIHFITIPEGLTNFEIISMVKSNYALKGEILNEYVEGSFLPETYDYVYGQTKEEFLQTLHKKQQEYIKSIYNKTNIENLGTKTLQEAVILASIIEKETGLDYERDVVSSVFHNRLKVGMPLQADPTVIYGITNGLSKLDRKLTSKDLKSFSLYNTYLNKGLPPTPICNPGKKSLFAALYPAKTNYLYFVSNNRGGHNFSSNISDHIVNVRNYRKE